jgi:DMSO/TMAO reductase YedYZ heme-binding membrane subunit
MTSQFWWYVARSGGVVAWGLSAASVLWGLMLSSRVLGRRVTLPKLLDLHRFLGGLSVVFVAVHMLGLVFDSTVHFGIAELLVPMASEYEPGAVAWGVVAFYLLVAVEVTSLLRSSVGENLWRKVHYGGFAVFLFGTIHGLKVGTDVENPLIWWPAALASAGVVGLCAYRIFAGEEMRIAPRSERVPTSLLEKTLTELERFDTAAYPQAAPAQTVAPERIFEPLSEFSLRGSAAPPVLAAPVAPPSAPVLPEIAPDLATPPPSAPPVPSRAPAAETLLGRSLPTRTPRRLSATTAPGAIGVWSPATRPVHDDPTAPPPPPDAVDPATGEPDPQAYRRWLREWLSYVESQP